MIRKITPEWHEFKKIAEFLGYTLKPCRNGMAWEGPHKLAVKDVFKLHGRLFGHCDPDCFKTRDNLIELIKVIKENTQVEIISNSSFNFCRMPFRDIDEQGSSIEDAIYKAIIKYVNL